MTNCYNFSKIPNVLPPKEINNKTITEFQTVSAQLLGPCCSRGGWVRTHPSLKLSTNKLSMSACSTEYLSKTH